MDLAKELAPVIAKTGKSEACGQARGWRPGEERDAGVPLPRGTRSFSLKTFQ